MSLFLSNFILCTTHPCPKPSFPVHLLHVSCTLPPRRVTLISLLSSDIFSLPCFHLNLCTSGDMKDHSILSLPSRNPYSTELEGKLFMTLAQAGAQTPALGTDGESVFLIHFMDVVWTVRRFQGWVGSKKLLNRKAKLLCAKE